jgi:hypothetical protein
MNKTLIISRCCLLYSICLFSVVCLQACEKVEDLLTFKINNEADFVVPSTIGINTPFSAPVPDVTTNSQQSFENNNTNINKVKDITLNTLDLAITSPSQTTFKSLKSIEIYISADGLEEKLIAHKNEIPTTIGSTLNLETTGEKLDNYVKKESYNLRTVTVVREATFSDVYINAKMVFKVTANL